jgi:hypothetical protein
MEQVANKAEGTFTMRLTYYGGQSWIGIGINHEDSNSMTPATAVIGRMLDGDPSILKYDLESDSQDGSGVIPMELQNLQNVSFTQTETTSVLQFTQLLNEDTQVVSDESVWIYAVGLPDNQWEGKHQIHGAFYITMDETCGEVPASAPTGTATQPTNVGADTTQDETGENGNTSDIESEVNEDTGPSASNAESSGIVQVKSAEDETHSLWIAHGVLMALAWGICAPLAIGAVMLRNVSFLASKGCWFKIHFYANIANIVFTSSGFFLAVVATNKQGDDHFTENTHTKAGMAIFFIAVFQFALAFFRPDPPKPPVPTVSKCTDAFELDSSNSFQRGSSQGVERTISVVPTGTSVPMNRNGEVEVANGSDSGSDEGLAVKSKARSAWEMTHRFVGIGLLGLAWYNCTSGIKLQLEIYNENEWAMAAFWGVTAGLSGIVFCLAYVVRV